MLPDDRTRFVGVQGLMQQKLEEGDTDTAMALAKKAFALRPTTSACCARSSTCSRSGRTGPARARR